MRKIYFILFPVFIEFLCECCNELLVLHYLESLSGSIIVHMSNNSHCHFLLNVHLLRLWISKTNTEPIINYSFNDTMLVNLPEEAFLIPHTQKSELNKFRLFNIKKKINF